MNREVARAPPSAGTIVSAIGSHTAAFVKRHPIPVGAYALGLVLWLTFTGLAISPEQQREFERALKSVDYSAYEQATLTSEAAHIRYYNSKGWFWTCDARCRVLREEFNVAEAHRKKEDALVQQQIADAKGTVGIMSVHGVGEVRALFWQRYGQGKAFAKRQTMWDAMFIGITAMGRDEGMAEFVVRVVINLLFNFTIGVFGAVVAFLWGLWSVIVSYQANPLTGISFFILASLAAISLALTFVLMLFGTVVGAGVALVAVGGSDRRQRVEGRRPGARLHWD